MNEQNSVLNIIGKVSGFLIQVHRRRDFKSPLRLLSPIRKNFMWIPQYTALFLGTAMFGMGLTIKREDFQTRLFPT